MAEIVNLRMARKARERARAAQQAAENRAKFGQTKAAREKARIDAEREAEKLAGLRRETDDPAD